jgi:cyanophycinase
MAIGGAISKSNPVVLREFVKRAGGSQAKIVILPQASALDDTGGYYENLFRSLGAKRPRSLNLKTRAEADDQKYLRALNDASGVFIAGGAQARLTALIGGTKLEEALHESYRRGAIIGGTSAGAAVLSRYMIAFGKTGSTPRAAMPHITAGFGFAEKIVFDQHFRQRDRLGRLIYAAAAHPGQLGVGVDEDTAAIVMDQKHILALGSGALTIVDASAMAATDLADAAPGLPIAVSGLRVHILTSGCSYNIRTRAVFIPQKMSLFE